MRGFGLLIALMFVTPAMAESVLMAAINRARTEARCPHYPKATMVNYIICDSAAVRPVVAEHLPEALGIYDDHIKGNLVSAKKLDAGDISGRQFVAEWDVRARELVAKFEEAGRKAKR